MSEIEIKLPSTHQIGDYIEIFTCLCGGEDCEGGYIEGIVVAVRFTASKVFYDILDNNAKVIENIDSILVIDDKNEIE